MKNKGFIATVIFTIAIASMGGLVGLDNMIGSAAYQPALAETERGTPNISAVEPTSGYNDVDTPIVISGENFEETATVYLGDTQLADVTWVDTSTLEAVVPWGMDTGTYDLIIKNTPEEFDILQDGFEVLQGLQVWTAGKIEGGIINEIVINPNDHNTLYAASSVGIGLFRSLDAGENWNFVLSGDARNVAIDPDDPNYLYLLGSSGRLLRSADAGDTYVPLETEFPPNPVAPEGIPNYCCFGIQAYPHPQVSGTVFATVCHNNQLESGFIKSNNHGETWDEGSMTGIDDPYINSLAIHPADPDKIVVGTVYGNIFLSEDGGEIWESISKPTPLNYIAVMAFNPHGSHELWVLGDSLIKFSGSEYTEWEEIPSPMGEPWELSGNPAFFNLIFSPNEAGTVYITWVCGCFKFDYVAEEWSQVGDYEQMYCPIDIAESPQDGALFIGDMGLGVYKSSDDGLNWFQKNQGLTAIVPSTLRVDPNDPSVIYGTISPTHGVYRGTQYGTEWHLLEEPNKSFDAIAADFFTSDRLFASQVTTICRSDDGGQTWLDSYCVDLHIPEQFLDCQNSVTVLRAHPEVEDVLLAGLRHWCEGEWHYGPGSIYYTNDGGDNWTQADTPESMKVVEDLTFDTVDANVAYAGTTDGFYRSDDTGQTWVRMEGDLEDIFPSEVGSIAVEPAQDPDDLQHIVVLDGKSGAIMTSTNQGDNWEAASYPNPEDRFGQLIFTPTDSPTLYAASLTGLRYSDNYGQTWRRAAGDLGYVNVIALATVKVEDRVILYATTPGGYAASNETMNTTASASGLRENETLVNPGVYRYTQMPRENYFIPLIMR